MKSTLLLFLLVFQISVFGQCNKLIENGDSLFNLKKYSLAREIYLNARNCDSSKILILKVSECQKYLKKETPYYGGCFEPSMSKKIVSVANKSFENKDFQKARRYYLRALVLTPNNTAVYTKLIDCIRIFNQNFLNYCADNEYEEIIINADKYFVEGCKFEAKECYQEALKLDSSDPCVKEIINLIIHCEK